MNDNTIIRLIQDGKTDVYADLVEKYHKNLPPFVQVGEVVYHGSEKMGYKNWGNENESRISFDGPRRCESHLDMVL